MIRTKRTNNTRQISGINITPFTDVCLVLLIIFMVTASALTKETSLNVKLPKAATGEATLPSSVTVRITHDQQIFLNTQPITFEQLGPKLMQLRTKYMTELIVIKADEGIPYRMVISTIDIAREVGIAKFAFATIPIPGREKP